MRVYGSQMSPFVRKVLVFAAEKGLAVEHIPCKPHSDHPEFKAASPLGKIPAFRDGDFRLADSSAICQYLEHRYPMPAMFPSTAEDHGRMIWFEEFADTVLFPVCGRVFFNLVVSQLLFNKPGDMAIVDKAIGEELPPLLDYLERTIDGPFLVGPSISLADIAVAMPLMNLQMCERPLDAKRWPKVARWHADLLARRAFQGHSDEKKAA